MTYLQCECFEQNFMKEPYLPRDGRGIAEHRQLFLRTGVISQAKGSAYVEQGATKVSLGISFPVLCLRIQSLPDFVPGQVLSFRTWLKF